jgi:hypothetical protein
MVQGPGKEPWEVYVVKGDADTLDKATDSACSCGIQDGDSRERAAASSSCCS